MPTISARQPGVRLDSYAFRGFLIGVAFGIGMAALDALSPSILGRFHLWPAYEFLFPASMLAIDIELRTKALFFFELSSFALINGAVYALVGALVGQLRLQAQKLYALKHI
jgi:hypothetical protein